MNLSPIVNTSSNPAINGASPFFRGIALSICNTSDAFTGVALRISM